jgi:hypothetical protein
MIPKTNADFLKNAVAQPDFKKQMRLSSLHLAEKLVDVFVLKM